MRRLVVFNLLLVALLAASCSDDDETYPNVVTEMADLYVSSDGNTKYLLLDNDKKYTISNPQSGYKANAVYRVLAGYTTTDSTAYVHSLTGVYILRDSTTKAKQDPTKVTSVWRTARFVNLHLSPLTQGGKQYWGFIIDSLKTATATDGTTQHHAYISVYHNQNGDATSYTTDAYASLPIDSIKISNKVKKTSISRSDAITLRIKTFDGQKTFEL